MRLLKIFVLLFLYKSSLDIIYYKYVFDIYNYLGFNFEFNITYYITSCIILLFYSYLYLKLVECKNASSLIYIIFYLLYFIPNLTYITFNSELLFILFSFFYTILLSYLYLKFPSIKIYKLTQNKKSEIIFYFLLYGVVLLMMFFVIYYNGFSIKFDFEEVYEIREKVQDLKYPSLVNYLKPIASMFVTAGAMYYLLKNNFKYALLFFIFGLMLYAFGAHKTDFVLLILTILLFIFYKDNYKKYLLLILFFLNCIILLLLNFAPKEFQTVTIGMYLRTFFVPVHLGFYHYDYYSSHNLLLLREHFLHWFDSNAIHKNNSPYVIANYYFGDSDMSSNTGLIGTDYAQFAWFSLIIMVVLRVFFLKLYDQISVDLNPKMLIISSFTFGFLFINGAFFTSLISGGFLIMCLLFYIMPRE